MRWSGLTVSRSVFSSFRFLHLAPLRPTVPNWFSPFSVEGALYFRSGQILAGNQIYLSVV